MARCDYNTMGQEFNLQIVTRASRGATAEYLCSCDDLQLFVVPTVLAIPRVQPPEIPSPTKTDPAARCR